MPALRCQNSFLLPQSRCVCAEKAATGTAKFSVVQTNQKVSNCPLNSMFLIKHPAQSDYITKNKYTVWHKARALATVLVYQEQYLYQSRGN